jgi:hypothetical protein
VVQVAKAAGHDAAEVAAGAEAGGHGDTSAGSSSPT